MSYALKFTRTALDDIEEETIEVLVIQTKGHYADK